MPTDFGLGHAAGSDEATKGAGAEVIRFSGKPGGTAPFATDHAKLDYLGKDIGNHDVVNSYLKMEKQRNGGCP